MRTLVYGTVLVIAAFGAYCIGGGCEHRQYPERKQAAKILELADSVLKGVEGKDGWQDTERELRQIRADILAEWPDLSAKD